MGYVSFDTLNVGSGQQNQTNPGVGFFALKNDKDEAIVRFMHDDTASFEIVATHAIQLNGKFRRINCVRTPNDPIDFCPLCERGEKLDYRFYIHLIQYTNNPDGTVSAEPKIWERSLSYANKLREYINNYGPMSDVICKIVRHGRAGDMKTEYEIIPNLNQQVYRPDVFKKVTGAFDDFKVLGRIVLDKNADEIREYLNTGNFPMTNNNEQKPAAPQETVPTQPTWSKPSADDLPNWSVEQRVPQTGGWVETTTTKRDVPDWTLKTGAQPVARPVRY